MSPSFPVAATDDRFELRVDDLRPGEYRLRLAIIHSNGAASNFDHHLKVDRDGKPNSAELNFQPTMAAVESAVLNRDSNARKLLAAIDLTEVPTESARKKLSVLSGLVEPPATIDLSSDANNIA